MMKFLVPSRAVLKQKSLDCGVGFKLTTGRLKTIANEYLLNALKKTVVVVSLFIKRLKEKL